MRKIGQLKNFAKWLSGSGQKQDETSPLIKIKVFNKRLARQIGKMEIQERTAKKKALNARKDGDIAGSRLHMKSSLQYRKWGHSTENFRVKMEGVQYRLEQAKVMGQFSKVAEDIVGTLQGLQEQVKMPEIAKLLSEMDLGFGSMEAMFGETSEQLEITDDASSTGVTEDEVNLALAEVDSELSIESGISLPSVPAGINAEAQIDDLEKEIKKLKNQRRN
ncbi:MAG: Snf7 family protein [Promethearchaeota archaeon]